MTKVKLIDLLNILESQFTMSKVSKLSNRYSTPFSVTAALLPYHQTDKAVPSLGLFFRRRLGGSMVNWRKKGSTHRFLLV